ncbi:hypothetical protein ACFQZT_21725 [Paenibacillus sp. GCM10027628]
MEMDNLLNELFSSQEDWSVKINENAFVVIPNDYEENSTMSSEDE